jgi:DNA-binding NarL/FixJ family response regulator
MYDVLLVDDHPVIRALLRQILEGFPDVVIVGEAEDGEEAVSKATSLKPTVALIDCHLPRLTGVEVTKLIKLRSPCTTIIALTAGEPTGSEMEMVSAGASAVLNKADVLQQLYPLIIKTCADRNVAAHPTIWTVNPLSIQPSRQ